MKRSEPTLHLFHLCHRLSILDLTVALVIGVSSGFHFALLAISSIPAMNARQKTIPQMMTGEKMVAMAIIMDFTAPASYLCGLKQVSVFTLVGFI